MLVFTFISSVVEPSTGEISWSLVPKVTVKAGSAYATVLFMAIYTHHEDESTYKGWGGSGINSFPKNHSTHVTK